MINKKLYQIIIDAEMTEDVMLKTVGKNIKNVRVEKKDITAGFGSHMQYRDSEHVQDRKRKD